MSLEDPALVVGSLEFQERLAELFGIPERAQPKEILFEDPHKSLGAAIALRLMDKSRRGLDAKESKFLLKKPGDKLRAMVMAKGKPPGDVFTEFAETFPNPLVDRFKGFKTGSAFGGMDSHTFHRAVIHGKEDGDLSLIGGQTNTRSDQSPTSD
jgi:hypothetical protein